MPTNRNIVEMVEKIRGGMNSGSGGMDGIYMAEVCLSSHFRLSCIIQ